MHWAANELLYDATTLTVLDHIYLEMRKFVTHPSYSKETVSENFRCDALFKLPKPNKCRTSYENEKQVIKDFLVPLQTSHVCPKDCVIFCGELEMAMRRPKCDSQRFSGGKPNSVKIFSAGLYLSNCKLGNIIIFHLLLPI